MSKRLIDECDRVDELMCVCATSLILLLSPALNGVPQN
jgi:hypothetical protein